MFSAGMVIRPILRSFRGYSSKTHKRETLLKQGQTLLDVHNVILNPTTKLPYREKDVLEHLESQQLLKGRNKIRYGGKKKATSDIDFSHIPIEDQCFLLFPGQGAQFVGMGKNVYNHPAARKIFDKASQILNYDIVKLCQDGPEAKLQQTYYCQPAVFVCTIAALEVLKDSDDSVQENITAVAGFSVGEYSALVAGGMISLEDALRLVQHRSQLMEECSKKVKSSMVTVRVNASSRLEHALADARKFASSIGELDICDIANYLYCGVRVIGGNESCINYLQKNQKNYNIEILKRLPVSAAFHTKLMDNAAKEMMPALTKVDILKPICNVYSNYTGHVFSPKKTDIRKEICRQINSPVKWEQIQQLLYRKHQDKVFPRFIEVGPGRQLGAMLLKTSKLAYKNYTHFSC